MQEVLHALTPVEGRHLLVGEGDSLGSVGKNEAEPSIEQVIALPELRLDVVLLRPQGISHLSTTPLPFCHSNQIRNAKPY